MIHLANVYVNVGKRLRELRKSRNLTQADIGEMMGISTTSVVNYEAATRKIPLEYLLQFAHFYGVTLDFLADNGPEPTVDGSAVVTARYAQLWREDKDIRGLTSNEAEQIYLFTKFLISQRMMKDGKGKCKE